MNYRSTIYSIIAIGYCLGCCPDKETPGLPPVTSEGKNTFACKINGEVFVADGSGTDTPNRGIYAVLESNGDTIGNILPLDSCDLIISASKGSNYVFIFLNPYLSVGKHDLRFNTYEYPIENSPENYGGVDLNAKHYITTSVDTGSVHIIRWDKKLKIIAGTFQYKAKNLAKRSETIEVTEGRFDLDYSKTH
jgi:hypothetical protein